MKVIEKLNEWFLLFKSLQGQKSNNMKVGFVPTMGALHSGHAALIKRAKSECDFVVLSIYVNPTQFDEEYDYVHYPKTLDTDLEMAEKLGADVTLLLKTDEVYPDAFRYKVLETELSHELCGRYRPGHFDGVLTVVLKLLQIVRPDRLYMGEKDYQQLMLVRGLVDAFFIPTEVIGCPIIRDADGLALSSRNQRLTTEMRLLASHFPKVLSQAPTPEAAQKELEDLGFSVDYIEEINGRRFGAVRLDGVRLIDNWPIPPSISSTETKVNNKESVCPNNDHIAY